MSAEPRKAPTQGVQPTENTTPKAIDEANPSWRPAIEALVPRRKPSLTTPRKYRPNRTTTAPQTTLTMPWYATRKAPTEEASAPMATNTTVKPSTKPRAFLSTVRTGASSPAAK